MRFLSLFRQNLGVMYKDCKVSMVGICISNSAAQSTCGVGWKEVENQLTGSQWGTNW